MHANKEKTLKLLKTAKGQMDGLIKMVEDDRYCIDISNQLLATQSILKKVNADILQAHLGSCVLSAEGEDKKQKLEEIRVLLNKLSR